MAPGTTVEDSPLEMLLKEQGTLQTPVGVFSAKHEGITQEPEQAQFYKQLIPLSKPKSGEQYAFKVDLDKCTGCKACVSACHSLNGLDDHETWRDVGTIHGFDEGGAYTQTVTTACHHCADPGCLNGCPVLAYEKDPETGIVRHLDDQCIGCQYCVLKCPYDVPKYSKKLGIVRKCDMCHSRLADGEAPACVQACPTEAISITIVNTGATIEAVRVNRDLLPGAPKSDYTTPTTQYVTQRKMPANTEAADRYALVPEHTHLPLVIMLTLTQASVGCYLASLLVGEASLAFGLALMGFALMGLGLAASTSHLGRPLGAWRAFLGLRRSWLSREIVVFGGCFPLAVSYTAGLYFDFMPAALTVVAGVLTVLSGVLGVFCSAMIYHDTQRVFWRLPVSAGKFFGTTLGLGLVAVSAVAAVRGQDLSISLIALTLVGFCLKFSLESVQVRAVNDPSYTAAKKSALLMRQPLRPILRARFICGGLGLVSLLIACYLPLFAVLAAGCLLVGELLERVLYFKAVVALKMPGAVKV